MHAVIVMNTVTRGDSYLVSVRLLNCIQVGLFLPVYVHRNTNKYVWDRVGRYYNYSYTSTIIFDSQSDPGGYYLICMNSHSVALARSTATIQMVGTRGALLGHGGGSFTVLER